MADDHRPSTDQHRLHDEQRSWHAEIGLQPKDRLWIVLSLAECQPLLMTPATEYRSSRAKRRDKLSLPPDQGKDAKGTHFWAKRLGELSVVRIPSPDDFRQLSVPLANFGIEILVVVQLRLELVKLVDPFIELDLLGEDTLTESTDLLQLLLLVIEE